MDLEQVPILAGKHCYNVADLAHPTAVRTTWIYLKYNQYWENEVRDSLAENSAHPYFPEFYKGFCWLGFANTNLSKTQYKFFNSC